MDIRHVLVFGLVTFPPFSFWFCCSYSKFSVDLTIFDQSIVMEYTSFAEGPWGCSGYGFSKHEIGKFGFVSFVFGYGI